MRLDGFGLFVEDMAKMIRFYRDVLGFEIKESEDTSNVYLVKDGTLFLLYGRKDFENMTHRRYEYIKGLNGHSGIALYVDTFEEVDMAYNNAIKNGATSVIRYTSKKIYNFIQNLIKNGAKVEMTYEYEVSSYGLKTEQLDMKSLARVIRFNKELWDEVENNPD